VLCSVVFSCVFCVGPLRSKVDTTAPKLRSNLRGEVSKVDLRGPSNTTQTVSVLTCVVLCCVVLCSVLKVPCVLCYVC